MNTRLTTVTYDHYVRLQMRKTPSGIVPIIQIDRRAREPLHRQIYSAYRTAIVGHALRPKDRVPSTRILASELGISRIPVSNAYAQLLAEGGVGRILGHVLAHEIGHALLGSNAHIPYGLMQHNLPLGETERTLYFTSGQAEQSRANLLARDAALGNTAQSKTTGVGWDDNLSPFCESCRSCRCLKESFSWHHL